MEYLITANRPFAEIEAQTIGALEQRGFVVRRTFSLHSATAMADGGTDGDPGYSVLMLYASGAGQQPLGLVTLYERGQHRIVIQPVLTPPGRDSQDVDAELVAALVLGGLDLCVDSVGPVDRIELEQDVGDAVEDGTRSRRLVLDPVCGTWIRRGASQAAIEHEGRLYHVCCPLCQAEFERDPERYARLWADGRTG